MKIKTGNNKVLHSLKTCDDGVLSVVKILYPLPPGLFVTKGGNAMKPGELLEGPFYAACRKIFDKVSTEGNKEFTVGEENLVAWIMGHHMVKDGRWYLKLNDKYGDINLQGGDSASKLLEIIDRKRYICLDAETM